MLAPGFMNLVYKQANKTSWLQQSPYFAYRLFWILRSGDLRLKLRKK